MEGLNIRKPTDHSEDYSVEVKRKKVHELKVEKDKLLEKLTKEKRQIVNLGSEKGAKNRLNVLPLTIYGFNLNKSEFRDGLHLRYGIEPKKLPKTCPCGHDFTIAHALHCPKGGYIQLRHNEIKDTIAKFMDKVCHDVEIEPLLQPLQGESFDNKSFTREEEAHLVI